MNKLKNFFSNWYVIGFILFAFCLVIQLLWLAAFFPGAMTPDSISLWKQSVIGSGYFNLQPYLYTIYLFYLRHIWDSPAIAAIIQVIVSASLVSGFSVFLLRKKANKWLVAAGYLGFVFSIPIMITNTIIHRDAGYAALVLLLSVIFVALFFQKQEEVSTTKMVLLGLLLVLIASMRYDGAFYLIFAPFLLYAFKLVNKKAVFTVLLTGLIGYFVVQVPLSNLFQIKEDRYMQVYDLETEFIAQIYHDNPNSFSASDLALMTKLTPLSRWRNFDPTEDFDYWAKYKNFNFISRDFRKEWNQMFFSKFWTNPASIVRDRFSMVMALVSVEKINGPTIVANDIGLMQRPLTSWQFRGQLNRLFHDTRLGKFTDLLVWSPLFLIIQFAFLVLAIVKKKKYLTAYILIGLASFIVIIPIVTSSQFRYIYPLYYSSFFVPALYTIKLTKSKKTTGFYQK